VTFTVTSPLLYGYFTVTLPVSQHQCSTLVYSCTLLLSAWQPAELPTCLSFSARSVAHSCSQMCLRTKGCAQPSPHSERFSSFSGRNVFSLPSAAYLEHCTCGARPVAKSLTDVPNGTSRRACVASVRCASRGASVCLSVLIKCVCVMSISN